MMDKKAMVLAIVLVVLSATVSAQTQVLQNPQFNGCSAGSSSGFSMSSWSGPSSYSFSYWGALFANENPGDSCFTYFFSSSSPLTQTNVVLDTSLVYNFETTAGCYNESPRGGSCTLSLTINGDSVPLSNNVQTMDYPIALSSMVASNIVISSSPAVVQLTYSFSDSDGEAAMAFATLTGVDRDLDHDGVINSLDNCPTVSNSGQADYDQDGVGDACECSPDNVNPSIECRPSISVTLSVAPFSSTVLPPTPVSSASDNCGAPSLSLDKTFFTLRDSVAPVPVKATAIDGNSKTASCTTSVLTRMIGSILTNPASSLFSLPRGRQSTLTWTTNVASFSSSDSVTIKLTSLSGAPVATVVNGVRFTDGGAYVTFSASLSNISTFKLNIFLNGNIPAGSHTVKFA